MAGLNTALDYLQSSMYTPEQQAEQSMLAEQARLSDSGLRRGILRGVHTTPALLANAAGQVVEPLSTGLSQPLFDYAQGEMQQAQQIPSLVPSYENVTGLRSGMRYVGEKIGENLPNMLVTAPFGVAGRVGLGTAAIRSPLVKTLAGASVGALPLQMGEMTQSMREDPAIMASTTPLERLGRSAAYGAITAPMEAADEALMLARGTGAGKAVKNIFKDGIKQGAKAAGARLIGAVPEAALTEGVPEVAQEATQHAMLGALNPSRDASKDAQQLKEAFFGGWAAGGGTSVAGRGAEVAWSNARGMQQKIGELLSTKQLPSWLRSADDRTVLDWDAQDDARRTANAEEVAGAMAGDETEAPEFRAQAADWLRRAQEGAAGWQDFAPVAAAREKYHAARKGAERFLAAAKGAWGDLGKEGKNLEFTPDDRIVFDAMRSAMDPASPLAKDEQRAVGLYNYLKQFLADNRTDVPVHALEDDFGGPEGLQGMLETMRALLQRAGAVQPDATFKERMTAMLADGRQRDLARAKLVLSNLKLEHGGELSPIDAIVMAQRIEDGLQRYPSMTAKQRAAFDKRLDEVFGVNAESVVEVLGYQKQRDEVSLAEDADDAEDVEGQPNPAMQTIFEQQGTARRFIGSAKAEPDDPLHGGLWRLDHPDEETRADIRKRMARTMRAERGTGNIVRSLNPKQYAEAAGVNLEELAQRLKTTVENLEAHPARMLMSDEKLLDKDRIDLSTEDVQRLAKGVVTELSQRVDEDVAANVEAALKQPAAEQRKALREMGLEHAVKVVRTKDGSVVKSNLAHGGAGRFTVKLQNGTELVLSAQELIKEMRKRVNEPKAKRPVGDADLLRHFAAGISSLLSNPDVASITVNDVWAREHTKERVRKESRAENKEAQNAYAGLVGRFGGYFQLSQEGSRRVTLMQAVRAQERGGDPADYMNVREKLENYPTVLLEGHLKRVEGLAQRATARMQKDAGKKNDGANLRRYRTILDAGRDILDEREEGPEQQNATVYEIQEDKEEEAQRKVRTHQEETDEPLHPHGRLSEKAAPKATGSLSEQRQPMDVPKGVSGKHFTPALRSLEAQVEKLYDLAEGKFQTALDSVLELVAQAADAVREGDKAKYARLLAQGQERLAKIAEGMLQRLEERGKAEQNAVKRGALRKEYATVKDVLGKEAAKHGVTQAQNNAQEASKPAGETISDTEMQRVKDYVAKVLGPQVATEFVNRLTDPKTGRFEGGSAQWIRKNGQAIIRIVARAANPMSKAHHEAMHEFFQRLTETNPEAADILRKAAGSAAVLRQIERFFHAEPNREQILKQLKNSEHERVAYMFQLWAAGELNVGPKTENLFQRIVTFLRKTFGMLNEDERAEAIMAAFHEGKMSEPNAVTQVLAKMNRAKAMERYSGEMKEAYRHVLHWVGTASGGLIGNENPYLDSIGRDFYNETGDKERAAFLIARDQKTNQMMNRVASIYADADKKDMDIALEYLQTGKTPADPQVKVLVDRTRLMLDQVYDYLEASDTGVKKRKNFFPRVWDVVTLSEQRDQFVADLLQHHAKDLKRIADAENASREKRALEGVDPKNKAAMKRALAEVRRAEPKDIAEGILSTLLENKGADPVQENEWRVGYTPFMQAANRRVLTWIDDKVFHKYYNKDLVHIMTTYSAQAAHAGEYSKKFGRGGQKLRDKLNEALVWEAVRYAEEKSKQSGLLEQARTFAIDGSAGKYDADSSNAAMKMEIMQFLAEQTSEDPQEFVQKQENALALAKRNIMAMEGTLGHDISEAWRKASAGAVVYENLRLLSMSLFSQFIDPLGVMVNGGTLSDAFNTFKRGIVGVVHGWKGTQPQDEMTALARRIGIIDSHHLLNSMGSLYSSLYLGKTARKLNDRLFRWNGVEMFTQQSRVGAMETGIELILRHLKQADQEQSKRFLDELGLKPEDKRLMKGDELDYTSPEIQQALMRFVDRSIVRPNAAIRPAYGSDPRAQILFHMKGFTYAFHKVILEKIAHEAKHGNYDPAFTAVLAYVPVMIAADTVRGLLSTGGDEPDWKKKWTLGDYVTHGVERAGLLGIPQLALDTVRWGPTELTGPASEQIVRAGRTVSKEMKQHERLQKRAEDSGKELDKLLAESDDPVYDASRRILRDALPLGTITKNLLIDQPVDSSWQGLRAAQH